MTYINPRAKVFKHLDRVAAWQAGHTPAPVSIEWDLSNRCSLGCQDCHFAHTHTKGPWVAKSRFLPMHFESVGDLADASLVKRSLTDVAVAGVQSVIWSGGGEPTLHPDWRAIVKHAAGVGLQQGMYTLGGHLTEDSAQELANYAAFVVVSLDAADGDAYADEKGVPRERFAAACQGIHWLANAGATVGVSFLLHAYNWRRAEAMVSLARTLGATYATFRPAIRFKASMPCIADDDPSWVSQAWPTLSGLAAMSDVEIEPQRFAAYRDWTGHGYQHCLGIRLNATITPDGRVWICPNRRGMPESCLGDLRAESFGTIWARHPARFRVDDACRVMCRLHPVNETLADIEAPLAHEAFI
jgi:MoaA/NifB/PqqE/SkfB family radical SAM enzyme